MIQPVRTASENAGIFLPYLYLGNFDTCGNMSVQAFIPETFWGNDIRGAEIVTPVYRWLRNPIAETPSIQKDIISGEGEFSEFPNVAAANFSASTCLESEPETETESLRGVLTVSHRHKIIHSDIVEINISKLRRWKPDVQINLGRIPEDDE